MRNWLGISKPELSSTNKEISNIIRPNSFQITQDISSNVRAFHLCQNSIFITRSVKTSLKLRLYENVRSRIMSDHYGCGIL